MGECLATDSTQLGRRTGGQVHRHTYSKFETSHILYFMKCLKLPSAPYESIEKK